MIELLRLASGLLCLFGLPLLFLCGLVGLLVLAVLAVSGKIRRGP